MPKAKDKSKVPKIFKAALKQVLKTGYAGLKVSAVAKEAGVATGTIYTYFDNKKDLINELFRELKRSEMEEIFRNYDPALSFYEGFKLLWNNYLKAVLREPERNIFIDQYRQSEFLDEQSRALEASAYTPFYDFLNQAKEDQIIKDMPTEVMAAQLIGGANEVARFYFGKSKEISEEVVEQCFEMAWQSIRK